MPSPFQTRNIAHNVADYTTVKAVTSAGATLTAADTGKLIVVDTSGGNTTIVLPAAAVGLTFKFLVWKTGVEKNLLINSPAAAAFYKGGVSFRDIDATGAQALSESNGTAHYLLDLDDPDVGTTIEVVCDGTIWYISGTVLDNLAPVWA